MMDDQRPIVVPELGRLRKQAEGGWGGWCLVRQTDLAVLLAEFGRLDGAAVEGVMSAMDGAADVEALMVENAAQLAEIRRLKGELAKAEAACFWREERSAEDEDGSAARVSYVEVGSSILVFMFEVVNE